MEGGGGGLRIYFLKNLPEDFRFVTLPLEIPEKTSFHLEIQQNCVTSLRNSKVKNQNSWKFHMSFYLNTPGKSASFSIDPWNFYVNPIWAVYPDIREKECNDPKSIEEVEKQSTPMGLIELYESLQVDHGKQDNDHNYIMSDQSK